MKKEIVYCGIDIAKAALDVALEEKRWQIANAQGAINQLVRQLKAGPTPVQIICEASGGFERGLVQALHAARVPVSLVQARRVRQFAHAAGIRAKTDRIDALVLVSFGQAIQPRPDAPPSPLLICLRQWESQRRHLSRLLCAEQNRLAHLTQAPLRRLSQSLIRQLKDQIETIDRQLAGLIQQDQILAAKAAKLTSFAGVGKRTATLLLAQMPELGTLSRGQVAALAGLAPFNRDSGNQRGKRFIGGGRRALRTGLYMAALVAARHNHILAPFYQRLRAAGKAPKLALTAVMRKLLIALNSALANHTPVHA